MLSEDIHGFDFGLLKGVKDLNVVKWGVVVDCCGVRLLEVFGGFVMCNVVIWGKGGGKRGDVGGGVEIVVGGEGVRWWGGGGVIGGR